MKTKNFFAAMCGVFLLAGAAFATYTAFSYKTTSMSPLTKANLEALTSREMIENVDKIAYAYSVHYTLVNHGTKFTISGQACPNPYIGIGGMVECPHREITVSFDCCNYLDTPTNGCQQFPTSCSSILKSYGIED